MLAVAVASIAGLSALGWRLPRELPIHRAGAPTAPRWQFFLVGGLVYPLIVAEAAVGAGGRAPAALVFAAICATLSVGLYWVLAHVGTERNARHIVAFSAGLLVFLIPIGLIDSFPLEFVLVADAAVIYFLYWLDRDLDRRSLSAPLPPAPRPAPT